MGEASENSSILKVFLSIDHNERITKRKKKKTRPNCKHLQTTNLMWLKIEICLRKKREYSEHCHVINCKRFCRLVYL